MFNTITPHELLQPTARKDYQLVDLRNPREFNRNSIAGSLNIPYSSLPDALDELSTSKKVILICNDGSMAGAARNFLMGYAKMQNVTALENGIAVLAVRAAAKKAG